MCEQMSCVTGLPGTIFCAKSSVACAGLTLCASSKSVRWSANSKTVVPLLQKRGAFREDYSGKTLRDHLRD